MAKTSPWSGGKYHWREKRRNLLSFLSEHPILLLQFWVFLQEFSVQVTEKQFVTSQVNGNILVYKPSRSGTQTYFIEAQRPPTLLLGEVAICF